MLKNCFLPVNYNKPKSQTCGEIICENLHEFIINCKLCKIKIFEFEEFVQHFKNVHLDETQNDNKTLKALAPAKEQEQEAVDNYERIIKLEITEDIESNKEGEIKNEHETELVWNVEHNDNYTDDDKDYEANTDDDEDYEGEDEEQSKSIMKKVIGLYYISWCLFKFVKLSCRTGNLKN